MTVHRATCTDCPWSIEYEDRLEVSDEMEDHGRKAQHDVELQKAVATDDGREETQYYVVDEDRAADDLGAPPERRAHAPRHTFPESDSS